MRGDLEQIGLSDIFQTLAMSKMEGILRICNPLDQRQLYFHDGFVQDLLATRSETRRLGQLLVRAGLVDAEVVHHALIQQKKTGQTLGQVLVEQGHIAQEEVDSLASYQAAEDLYSLFAWPHGTFEFYKGPPRDPEIRRLLPVVSRFEINGVLLEVARRSDEWALILEALGSIDEVVVLVAEPELTEPDGDLESIVAALDHPRSIRELSDLTLLGLFDCARTVKQLYDAGCVTLASPTEVLDVAENWIRRGDVKRAIVTLRTLYRRGEALDREVAERLAALLERAGDASLAGRCLIELAEQCEDPAEAVEILRSARRTDTRSIEALRLLEHRLAALGRKGDPEYREVCLDLADALLHRGDCEEALELVEGLRELLPEDPSVLSWRAKALHKGGRNAEAVATLLEVASLHRAAGQRDKEAQTYSQILKIDYRNKDALRALRGLRSRRAIGRLKLAAAGLALVAGAFAGVAYYEDSVFTARLEVSCEEIESALEHGNLKAAGELLVRARSELGEVPRLEHLASRLRSARAKREAEDRARRERAFRQRLAAAAEHLERGEVDRALAIYAELAESPGRREDVAVVVTTRLKALHDELEALRGKLPVGIPDPPSILQSHKEKRMLLRRLEIGFPRAPMRRAEGILAAAKQPAFRKQVPPPLAKALIETAEAVVALYRRAHERRRAYRRALDRIRLAERLNPLLEAALAHEKAGRFAEALAAYRRLAAEHPDEDELKVHFRERVRFYSRLLDGIRKVDQATAAGDYEAALEILRGLRGPYAALGVDALVRLPLRIESSPPGAEVLVADRRVGTTPVLVARTPTIPTEVRIGLEGFEPFARTVRGDQPAAIRVTLAYRPHWRTRVEGSVEFPPALAGDHAYLTDRSGTLTALDLRSGNVRWRVATGDLSGLLPTPVVAGDRVHVASVDGKLRCLRADSGAEVWTTEGLPSQGAPAVVGEFLVVATVDRRVVVVDRRTGAVRTSAPLPGASRVAVVPAGPRTVLVAMESGRLSCFTLGPSGKPALRWRHEVGQGLAAAPVVREGVAFVGSDNGRLWAIAVADGTVRWHRDGLSPVERSPACTERYVLVGQDRRLQAFSVRDGTPGPTFTAASPLSSPPAVVADRIAVGDRSGAVHLLDAHTLTELYLVRGPARPIAPVAGDSLGRGVFCFEDGHLFGFHKLP